MIKNIIPLLGVFAVAPFISAQDENTTTPAAAVPANAVAAETKLPELTPEKKQLFLQGLGWIMAKQSGITTLDFTPEESEEIAKGFLISLKGEGEDFVQKITPLDAEYSAFIQSKQEAAQKKMDEKIAADAKVNKEAGAAYIAKCKEDKTYKVLESGVLMKVEKAGDDKAKPTPQSYISVRYTGKLIDGTIFDSSERDDKGLPVQFTEKSEAVPFQYPLEGLIPGWIEALQQVGKGAKVSLVIPSEQAYGDRQAGNIIKPGSTLVFDIELVEVSDKSLVPETPAE